MSFFDNTKIAGWGLFLCAILMIISAIISIYNGAVKEGDDRLALVVAGIGALLAAFIYFGFGNSVRKGEISKKIDVLAQFVKTVGVATIVASLFGAIAGTWGVSISTWSNVGMIILGIINTSCHRHRDSSSFQIHFFRVRAVSKHQQIFFIGWELCHHISTQFLTSSQSFHGCISTVRQIILNQITAPIAIKGSTRFRYQAIDAHAQSFWKERTFDDGASLVHTRTKRHLRHLLCILHIAHNGFIGTASAMLCSASIL